MRQARQRAADALAETRAQAQSESAASALAASDDVTREIEAQIREVFGSHVLKTVIPRNVDLAAAPGQGLAIRDWVRNSRGGEAYHELALEVKKLWL